MNKGNHTEEQRRRLDELGFVWDVVEYEWEKGFKHLVSYCEEFGDCRVKAKTIYRGYILAEWVANLRRKKDQLTTLQINRLDELGFIWKVSESQWNVGFECLVAYKEEYGDCKVPVDANYLGYELGPWCSNQRSTVRTLNSERRSSLDKLGFIWNTFEQGWEQGFKHLTAYKKEFGDCLVERQFQFREYNLGIWVAGQRTSPFNAEYRRRLDELGFVWDVVEYKWEKGFKHLVSYCEEFGDCWVKAKTIYRGYNLSSWVNNIRSKQDAITSERRKRLDALGFVWSVSEKQWENGFNCLVAYKEEFGSCLVPVRSQYRDFNLGPWVASQRIKRDTLISERLNRLDELGFVWNVK